MKLGESCNATAMRRWGSYQCGKDDRTAGRVQVVHAIRQGVWHQQSEHRTELPWVWQWAKLVCGEASWDLIFVHYQGMNVGEMCYPVQRRRDLPEATSGVVQREAFRIPSAWHRVLGLEVCHHVTGTLAKKCVRGTFNTHAIIAPTFSSTFHSAICLSTSIILDRGRTAFNQLLAPLCLRPDTPSRHFPAQPYGIDSGRPHLSRPQPTNRL